jgi:thiol:disulfide interchange protein DsbD
MEFDPGHPELSAFLLGLVYGATYCTLVCSPFIASYIVGSDRGTSRGIWLSFIFNGGRILTYGLLGLGVGLMGAAFLEKGDYARVGALAFGLSVAAIGIWITVRRQSRSRACSCADDASLTQRIRHRFNPQEGEGGEMSAGLMGLLIGLVPCPPLIAILVVSATMGSASLGLVLALLFGIGTSISPIIVIAGAAGWFTDRVAKEAPLMTSGLRRVAGLLLIILGIWTAYRAYVADGSLI